MTHYITLSDNDVLFMDEVTGDILVNYDSLPPRVFEGDTVNIHFEEDDQEIQHQFIVKSENRQTNQVELHWVKQLNEKLLTEAPKFIDKIKNAINPDMATKITQGEKASEKNQKKQAARFADMIKKEVAQAKTSGWEFYIQLPDGKNIKTPVLFDDIVAFYKTGNDLNPAIVNAIVTSGGPDKFLVRKGKENYEGIGIKYSSSDASIKPNYAIPWDKNSIAQFKEILKASTKRLKDIVKMDIASNKEETSVSSEKQASSETKKETSKRYDLGISSNTYKHFLKILYVLKPKLYDAFDKPVNVSDIKELGEKVKYNNLADFEIEIDGNRTPVIQWIKSAVKNKVLMEKVLTEAPIITLSDTELNNPDSINLKDVVTRASEKEEQEKREAAKLAKEKLFREKNTAVYKQLVTINGNKSTTDVLNDIFDELVPSSGKAETVAGEYVRAIMRILYRDYNDGDMFFTGYGLETCGSSAAYLSDNSFDKQISQILEQASYLSENEDVYTSRITDLAQDVLDYLVDNEDLFYTENTVDSRDYSYEYIEEHQPTYEFECYGSDDIVTLVEKDILTSWDLKNYVEDILSYNSAYNGADIDRPWTHHDTSVTVSNLTKDGLELLKDTFERDVDSFWSDLVNEHADELEDDSDEDLDDNYDLE